MIKKLYNKAKDRDFSLVFQGIAFFIVAADMMSDPEAREGLMALAGTINSTEDFLTWVEYFSLADPEILADMLAYAEQPPTTIDMPFAGLIPEAHAKLPPLFGRVMGRAFNEMEPLLKDLGSNASTALKKLVEVAKDKTPINAAKVARIRKVMFNKEYVKGLLYVTKRGGIIKLRKWLLGYNGQRIPPLALIMTAFYVEEEVVAGRLFPDTQDSFDRERNDRELTKLFIGAVPATFTGQNIAMAHGKSFHLLQLALFHALSEANTPGIGKVKGIEVYRDVPVFRSKDTAERKRWNYTENFRRVVDIALEGSNSSEESWWELKSWKATSKTNRAPAQGSKTWTFLKGKSDGAGNIVVEFPGGDAEESGESHKQFCLDRIAEMNGARYSKKEATARGLGDDNGPKQPPLIKVNSFNWQFHKFSVGNIISPTGSKLEAMFVKDPHGDASAFKEQRLDNKASKGRINLGATEELMEILKQSGFALAEEALNDIIVLPE